MDYTKFTINDAFTPIFKSSRLLHSYIIIGNDDNMSIAFADTLASAMICTGDGHSPCGVCKNCKKSIRGTHPDIIHVSPPEGKKELSVAAVRAVRSDASIMPNEADYKVYIIENAELMNSASQNALLKTLEEPPRHARFILTTQNPALLLDTVRSRCAEIRLYSENSEHTPISSELSKNFFEAVQGGALSLAVFTYSLEKLDKDAFSDFVVESRALSVKLLKAGQLSPDMLFLIDDTLKEAAKYLKFNVNPVHISGMLCAKLMHSADMPLK